LKKDLGMRLHTDWKELAWKFLAIETHYNTAKKKSNTKNDLKETSKHANIKLCALKQVFNLVHFVFN